MRLIGVYCQTSGSFLILDGLHPTVATGYSGAPGFVNDGTKEHLPNRGPIPRGRYLVGEPHEHKKLGPVAMTLFPHGHSAQGRSGFMIHGDNAKLDRSASQGCVILDRASRLQLAAAVREAGELVPYIVVMK